MKTAICRHCGSSIVKGDQSPRDWYAPDSSPPTVCAWDPAGAQRHQPNDESTSTEPKVGDEVWVRGEVTETGYFPRVEVGNNNGPNGRSVLVCKPNDFVKVIPAAERVTLKGNPVADVRKELKRIEEQVVALTEELRDVGVEP